MRFAVKTTKATRLETDLAIVAVFEKGAMSDAAKELDKANGGFIREVLKNGDIAGKPGDLLLLTQTGDLECKRVLLVGCGNSKKLDRKILRRSALAAYRWLTSKPYANAASFLAQLPLTNGDTIRAAQINAELLHTAAYRFNQMKSKSTAGVALKKLVLAAADGRSAAALKKGVARGDALGSGMSLTKDLANLPGNVCTPSYLVKEARKLAKGNAKISCTVLSEADMQKLGMGAFLSVTAGSDQPGKFIILEYKGATPNKKPVVLVGKGITFDTGGISLKPPGAMDEMKFDMSGAASVFGTMRAISELKPRINLVCLIPTCENMPGGSATKPGDIVTSMSGQTIEVLNTDAEGRLILCDALTYAQRFEPAALIDVATLTGACVIALGKHHTGLLSSSDKLADKLIDAGDNADDRAWRLPLTPEYAEQLKSNFADFANIGGREAGTITAASFLSKFTEGMNWAHLDIAGTAYVGGVAKGNTGRPVPLLLEFLLDG